MQLKGALFASVVAACIVIVSSVQFPSAHSGIAPSEPGAPVSILPEVILPPAPSAANLSKVTFPVGTIVLPMDWRQADITAAFGFAHAMLRNNSFLFRIIGPPDVTLKTDAYPSGGAYAGGPIMIMPSNAGIANAVKAAFASVSLEILQQELESDKVFIVKQPTEILVINGSYGQTYNLLSEMQIPFDWVMASDFQEKPEMINNYTLVIDDCTGVWIPSTSHPATGLMRDFVARGNEIIFTCWALHDFNFSFPGYVNGEITPSSRSRMTNITAQPDFPAQYYGSPQLTFDLIYTECNPAYPNATVIAKGDTWSDAFYYYYGKGIAEFFSFHPGEQSGPSRNAAITLYGNKFLHILPIDSGITPSSSITPKAIATAGTSDQASEQAALEIGVKPVGMFITKSNALTVQYTLHPYINAVAGTYSNETGALLPPDSETTNPDGSKNLTWNVPYIARDYTWKVIFNITSSQAGLGIPVNIRNESVARLIDDFGKISVRPFTEQKVDVSDGLVIGEVPVPLIASLGLLGTVAVVLSRKPCPLGRPRKR